MHRITVMNSKGGCGKTTLATNLAAYYAKQGNSTCLIDFDPQGSSLNWLRRRSDENPFIYGFVANDKKIISMDADQPQLSKNPDIVIADAPAGIGEDKAMLQKMLKNTDTLILPVLPSPVDIHACARFIGKLLVEGGVKEKGLKLGNIGIVANRVKTNTVSFRSLDKFLDSLGIPFVTSLKDAQNYVFAYENSLGVSELKKSRKVRDEEQWGELIHWLDKQKTQKS